MAEIEITEKRKVPACDKCKKRPAAFQVGLIFTRSNGADDTPDMPGDFSGLHCATCAYSLASKARTVVHRKRTEATAK